MKKDIIYYAEYNGLVFNFDYAERSKGSNYLWFYRKCFYCSDVSESICFIDLDKCVLKFTSKHVRTGAYYFDIFPIKG